MNQFGESSRHHTMNNKTSSLSLLKSRQSLNELVLSLLSNSNHLNHLKQVQSFLTKIGHSRTQFFVFKLLRFSILKLSNIYYARYIFDRLPSPNIYLHAAMVTAYASLHDHSSSFDFFRLMLRRGNPMPNHFIFPHVLKNNLITELVHAHVEKSGFFHYPVVKTALVDSYSKSGNGIIVARELFDEIDHKNVVSWTAMICGYARVGQIKVAIDLFDKMPEKDVASWNAVISGCAQNGYFYEAISLFGRMVGCGGCDSPNEVTLVCALSACGNTGMLWLGSSIHGYAYRNGHCMEFLSNALVDMYGKCGSFQVSRRVFELSLERSLKSWNSMINCFALHGQSEKAIRVFEEMRGCGDNVRPDGVTFVGLLSACTHGGLVDKGRHYFKMMQEDYGIEPQIEHYGCLIDILGRAGRFDDAMEVVREMKMEPDEVVWGSLLNGSKIHGRTDLAKYAVRKLVKVDPNNGSCGTVLANLYKELGKWDEVCKLRKLLKKQSTFKIPGYSWIEADAKALY